MSGAKAVCAKHERAYDVSEGCPYCEPVEVNPDPRALTSADTRWATLRTYADAGVLSMDDVRRLMGLDVDDINGV